MSGIASSSDSVKLVNLADRMQPVIHQTAALAVDRGAHAAAAVMPDHHNVLHLDHIDGELEHREIVRILGRREIGDVAVHEQLAGVEPDNVIGRHAAVGTADPQIFGRLLGFEPAEEPRIGSDLALGPGAIVVFQMIEHERSPSANCYGPQASDMP